MDTQSQLQYIANWINSLTPSGDALTRRKIRGYRRLLKRMRQEYLKDLNRPQAVSKAVSKVEREAMGY